MDRKQERGRTMAEKLTKKAKRTIAVAAVSGALVFGFGGTASAVTNDGTDGAESYPVGGVEGTSPPVTVPATTVPTTVLPSTGSDSTGLWLKVGGGAVLAGGLLVAATARRRHEEDSAVAS